MKERNHPGMRICCIVLLVLLIIFLSGCKRSDISTITDGTLEDRTETIGRAFNTCPVFTNTNWDRTTAPDGSRIVVFTADLPLDALMDMVSADSGNWLTVEKRYFEATTNEIKRARIKITFPINGHVFRLQDIMFGISSSTRTAWSAGLNAEDREKVINSIYDQSTYMLTVFVPYVDPSLESGAEMFYLLTGRRLEDF